MSYLGIDIGGTKILAQLFDDQLKLKKEVLKKTIHKSEASFIKELFEIIESLLDRSVKGIGIAVPGTVDIRTGTIIKAPHLPLRKNYPMGEMLKKKFKLPIWVDHDINAFLFAETRDSKRKKWNEAIGVMIGTGVGGALMIKGELFYGAKGLAGEVGHMIQHPGDKYPTVEHRLGGCYLNKRLKDLKINPKNEKAISKLLLSDMQILLTNLNWVFAPEVMILGGSMYHHYLQKSKKEIAEFIAKHSHNGKSPILLDGQKKPQVAKGVVMLLLKNHF